MAYHPINLTDRACLFCGTVVPMRARQVLCRRDLCQRAYKHERKTYRGYSRGTGPHQKSVGACDAPVVKVPDPPPVRAPQVILLPNGMLAERVWAGDMWTPNGKGALLATRTQAPYVLDAHAPGNYGLSHFDRSDPARRKAQVRQQKRSAAKRKATQAKRRAA